MISGLKKDIDVNLQRCNKINDKIEINIGTQMSVDKTLRLCHIKDNAELW
jgi:hypothetical protein